jgi:hypothetical protein
MPITKPTVSPRWAEDALGNASSNIATPSDSQIASGWTNGQVPPSSYMNWFQYWLWKAYQWLVDVQLVAMGAFDNAVSYDKNSLVEDGGQTWRSKQTVAAGGGSPSAGANWELWAAKGAKGDTGPSGYPPAAWDVSASYTTGDHVIDNGVVWRALNDVFPNDNAPHLDNLHANWTLAVGQPNTTDAQWINAGGSTPISNTTRTTFLALFSGSDARGLDDGLYSGQRKTIRCDDGGTSNVCTVTPTTFRTWTHIVFTGTGGVTDGLVELEWSYVPGSGQKWVVLDVKGNATLS